MYQYFCTEPDEPFPANPFTILEPEDQGIGEFYVVQERRATDFKAPELWKSSSGCTILELYNHLHKSLKVHGSTNFV